MIRKTKLVLDTTEVQNFRDKFAQLTRCCAGTEGYAKVSNEIVAMVGRMIQDAYDMGVVAESEGSNE